MKKMVLALLCAILSACGGGGDPVTLTQVDAATAFAAPRAAEQPAPAASAPDTSAKGAGGATTPKVIPALTPAPTVPTTRTTDLTFGQVNMNMKGRLVSPGQREVNTIAFNVAVDGTRNASVQEIVLENIAGNNSMFSQLRFVDAQGDVCPRLICYIQYDAGGQVRVVFDLGWRPENELQVFALQGDISPYAPVGTKIAFRVKTVYMRQFDTSADQRGTGLEGTIIGSSLETMTIVSLPTIESATSRQIVNTIPGKQYEVIAITATCPVEAKNCEFKRLGVYTEAQYLAYEGYADMKMAGPNNYLVEINHWWQPGTTHTWRFQSQATGNSLYTSVYDLQFLVDGIPVAPKLLVPNTETVDGGVKG